MCGRIIRPFSIALGFRLVAIGSPMVMAIALLSGADPTKEAKAKTDKESLQGAWEVVEQQPEALPRTDIDWLIFKGDRFLWDSEGHLTDIDYKLNPTAKPQAIDLTPREGGAKGKTYPGIYQLDGDRLTICYRGPGKERPNVFTTEGDAVFLILKREPAGKPGKSPHLARLPPLVREPKEPACLKGHTNKVMSVALTADGRTLASGSSDKSVRVWDLATDKERAMLGGHDLPVLAVAITADGRTVVSGDQGGVIKFWDVGSGRERVSRTAHAGRVLCLALAADGRTLASASDDRTVKLWEMSTGRDLVTLKQPATVSSVTFSPDGRTLAWGGQDRIVRLWDRAAGKERAQLKHTKPIGPLAFSPDGKTLATGIRDAQGTGRTHLWEVSTGKKRASWLGQPAPLLSMDFHASGMIVATALEGSSNVIKLWDAATGEEWTALKGTKDSFSAVAFSADGNRLAAAVTPDNTIRVWDVSGLRQVRRLPKGNLSESDLKALWADLAGDSAPRAYQAVCVLAAAPGQAAPWLSRRLRPIAAADVQRLARLIDDLNSVRFAVRDKAAHELEQLGESAGPALHKVLDGRPALETRQRVKRLLEKIEQLAPESLRVLRAIEALEQAGTPETQLVLKKLAGGVPGARLTREATASLHRLAANESAEGQISPRKSRP